MTDEPTVFLQERIADLERQVADLSDEVARQAVTVDRLTRLTDHLAARERARAEAEGGGIVLGDERPPHW